MTAVPTSADTAADTNTDPGHRRQRVRLTPRGTTHVPFTGTRAAEGPLTLGQINIAQWLGNVPDHFYSMLCVEFPVPPGATVGDVTETIAVLGARHETLRTTYRLTGERRQVVAASGTLPLDVCVLGDGRWGPRDQVAVAGALVRWLRANPDPAGTPMHVVVAVAPDQNGPVIACAAALSHMAVDHGAIEVLKREFAELVGDPATRQVGGPRHQPLDQAALEATPTERRRAQAAQDYLQHWTQRIPRRLYDMPDTTPGGDPLAVALSSRAAALAVAQVAARTRASGQGIVLGAICAVLAHRTGDREIILPLMSSNRFERHLVDYVGSVAQGTIAGVEVAGRSFDALVKRAWTVVLEASRNARYDASERARLDERIAHERGLLFKYEPLFNSLVTQSSGPGARVPLRARQFDAAQLDAALAETRLRWRPAHRNAAPVRFELNRLDGRLELDLWSADTGVVSREEAESLLLAFERLVVAAAHEDLDPERMREVIGLETAVRSADWIFLDSCWVDVRKVQDLVDDALAPAVTRVFADVDGRPLVAFVAAKDGIRTPEQAHARCMAALPEHPMALAPRHYVLCATAPADPADLASWPEPTATGTGRTPG
ncbi:hypothetical protein [Labedaea rhizosphaerae]|uniref:Condensation domain-containing protein n=1 Tax=Labedaea rhizosphaerae TaxID=598644 RepID=A0A4R6S1A3_LABRH|nr:hypothetical protein [Labedaea rhizosphaerae]TDP92974.1 hypothetical protein EV186_107209 [Labedaea rhizosphaerae]